MHRNFFAGETIWSKLAPTSRARLQFFISAKSGQSMSGMPLARIYASLVEEAEPLRADLLARGYNVEVVFPDAELAGPADLELRLERCSPAQAIARVEADTGSPSRCVFLTPSKGPERDLLLIEMTVAATGTYSRHPLYVPVCLPGATLAEVPRGQVQKIQVPKIERQSEEPDVAPMAVVLPFPESNAVVSASSQPETSETSAPSAATGKRDGGKKNDDDWDKLVGAEVTAFLAHAPRVETATFSFAEMGRDLLHSRVAQQARNRWEMLSLIGVASSVLVLLYVGWHAGPSRPWQPKIEIVSAAPVTAPVAAAIQLPSPPVLEPTPRLVVPSPQVQPHVSRWRDRLVAQDTVQAVGQRLVGQHMDGQHFRSASIFLPLRAASKTSLPGSSADKNKPRKLATVIPKPVQASRASTNPIPIKKITDLK